MNPIGAARYLFYAAIIVISLFFGLRLLFAHKVRRENWRDHFKHRFYLSRQQFKVASIGLGCLLVAIGLLVAYFQILGLVENR